MNYCPECGSTVSLRSLADDERPRFVCTDCGETHYQSPAIIVAVYVCVGREILWLKRGTAPAKGFWAIPGGYMERDETPEAAASRELREETGLAIHPDQMTLVSVSSVLNMAQTHLVFRCHVDEKPSPTVTREAVAFGWYKEDDVPWKELAFPSIEPHVHQVYRWLQSGEFGIRVGSIDRSDSHYKTYRLVDEH